MAEYYPGSSQDYPPYAPPDAGGQYYPPSPQPIPDYVPPGYAPQDPGDYVTPPPQPPSTGGDQNATPPPAPAPQPAPPVYTDQGYWGGSPLAVAGNMFYRVTRRVRATRVTRELYRAARTGLEAVFQHFQQVPSPPTGTAVVPYVERGAGYLARLGRGLLGGTALSQVIGLAFPSELSDSDQFPLPLNVLSSGPLSSTVRRMVYDQKRKESLRVPNAQVQELLRPGPDVILGTRDVSRGELIRSNLRNMVEDPELLLGILERGKRNVVTATAPGFNDYTPLPDILVTARRISGPTVGPRPTGMPPSTSSPTPSSSGPRAGKGGALAPGKIRWGRIGIGVGAVIGANFILPRLFGGSPYATPAYNAPGATIDTPPATPVSPILGSAPGAVVGAFGGAGGFSPYCVPAPRGPRRRCLERAPVSWRSGSRKGKAAGTKCLRYASRAS